MLFLCAEDFSVYGFPLDCKVEGNIITPPDCLVGAARVNRVSGGSRERERPWLLNSEEFSMLETRPSGVTGRADPPPAITSILLCHQTMTEAVSKGCVCFPPFS